MTGKTSTSFPSDKNKVSSPITESSIGFNKSSEESDDDSVKSADYEKKTPDVSLSKIFIQDQEIENSLSTLEEPDEIDDESAEDNNKPKDADKPLANSEDDEKEKSKLPEIDCYDEDVQLFGPNHNMKV